MRRRWKDGGIVGSIPFHGDETIVVFSANVLNSSILVSRYKQCRLGTESKKRKPTQAVNTGSSTSAELLKVFWRSSSAFAFVVSSFLERFLNSTTRWLSDICERSGGSVMYESCEVVEEKVLGEPNPPKEGEEVPKAWAALLLRAEARFLDIVVKLSLFD